jgi:hypothetical protein
MSDRDKQLPQGLERLWRQGPIADKDKVIYYIARDVSKLGDLSSSDCHLRAMRTFFSVEDAVELYKRVRDQSLRFEGEWRGQFVAYFPAVRDALPPQRMTEGEYDEWLRAEGGEP